MKILIAEDVEDLLEVMALMVQGVYPDSEILLSQNGSDAIQKIDENPDLDLVLSDYNMPHATGGKVYEHLRLKQPTTPFLLTSSVLPESKSEFRDVQYFATLAKPFTDDLLEAALRKMEADFPKTQKQAAPVPSSYVPIPIEILKKIKTVVAPLFLKLSDHNFVKVLNIETIFDQVEFERFTKKKTKDLWIEISNYQHFIESYKKEVLSREAWKELDDAKAVQSLALDHQVIMNAGRTFGWSDETVELTLENIKQVSKLLERHPKLSEVTKRLKEESQSRLSTQSVLLAIACTAIVDELGWESPNTHRKLTFAALLHDMDLDEEMFITMMTIIADNQMEELKDDPDLKPILNHPLQTAEMLVRWPLCPPDVDVIIRQHHERPDGKGFPLGLDASRIAPLSALLIVAEDMIFHAVDNFGADPKEYLISKRDFYSRGEFRKIYEATLRSLNVNTKAS